MLKQVKSETGKKVKMTGFSRMTERKKIPAAPRQSDLYMCNK